MKQTITAEQLNELSGEGKLKLKKWYWGEEEPKFVPTENDYLLLSIGQMIEFLDDKADDHIELVFEGHDGWHVKCLSYEGYFSGLELADALWSACVEVLNEV